MRSVPNVFSGFSHSTQAALQKRAPVPGQQDEDDGEPNRFDSLASEVRADSDDEFDNPHGGLAQLGVRKSVGTKQPTLPLAAVAAAAVGKAEPNSDDEDVHGMLTPRTNALAGERLTATVVFPNDKGGVSQQDFQVRQTCKSS